MLEETVSTSYWQGNIVNYILQIKQNSCYVNSFSFIGQKLWFNYDDGSKKG